MSGSQVRLPPVRLASREELAAAARTAQLLRAARELAAWTRGGRPAPDGQLSPSAAAEAAAELDLSPVELRTAWSIATATGMIAVAAQQAVPGERTEDLDAADPVEILTLWAGAFRIVLGAEDLDGLATVLYTAGEPVRIDALFEAYAAAAAGSAEDGEPLRPSEEAEALWACGEPEAFRAAVEIAAGKDDSDASGLAAALETFADLGVVELGTDEEAGRLTVSLSALGVWGMHDRLSARGWRVPVLGGSAAGGAAAVLKALGDYDAEDGEAEIAAWLARRSPERAAAELTQAASAGSPGLRGAAFAVMDRVGEAAVPAVRLALANPVLRPHAAVWLLEHGEQAELSRTDRTWLLVDLGAGLLEEAAPEDVVAELLPDLPPRAQADLVADLWHVGHPGAIALLTTLSDHHPDPDVAKAARKAAFKARSRA
jgi:hypothetical protein